MVQENIKVSMAGFFFLHSLLQDIYRPIFWERFIRVGRLSYSSEVYEGIQSGRENTGILGRNEGRIRVLRMFDDGSF